ncbi:EAL domain-containing protein [Pseudomonas sp. MAP12]|uniref:EAL domain-containing protein n=1 Tax=Geopseudomonas aromaticivorans TaxID=2849492 RepID=A0ABS6N109_9GAMM|nr:bifunctional diguanylate cyclase/phosphodiesterase [Pseudomonas aromaticivorans]MBV2134237.1 EAL domain-containing protein [Pseudomonas aromaticivorans]
MTKASTCPALWAGEPAREVSEARFQKLFDEADAMSIQGYLADGTVVYWNRASERIYGYSASEALGANLLELIIPADLHHEVEAAMRWMFESGQGIPPARLQLRHKNGQRVPVYSSHTLVTVPGHPPVLFCMDADMSHLQQAETELRVAAAAFESQQGMFITDARGVILRVNQAFTRTTGYAAEEAVGHTPRLIKSNRHTPDFYTAIWRSLQDNGSWQGEIWDRRKNGEEYADWVTITAVRDAQGRVTHYVGTQTDVTQRKEAEAKILQLAFYDPLTGLPNRRLLLDRLQQALAASQRNHSGGALLFIDLDNFKTLNDTRGHDTGDLLLQQVAARLIASIRDKDTAARLGGDEFVVMLEDLGQSPQEAASRAEAAGRKLLATLNQRYRLRGHGYEGSVSIGITLFPTQDSSTDELMKQADLAMYEAKAAGRNALRFFDPQMQAAVTQRAALVSGLREGLRKQQFRLYYQPQVDRDGRLLGFEALLRWQSPQRGLVSPAEFVPVAEESGLILPLGLWVLESACSQLAAWARQPASAGLSLAVNVSASQFARADFVEQVLEVLARTGANPRRLKLELTESLLVARVEEVIAKMSALKARGVGFSLDDFGTGYSSLAYLRRLPLDQLKIDKSFVRDLLVDPNSAAIAHTIIVLSQTMGLAVIAEGVESASQRDLLASLGCQAYQGYLFGQPLPLEQAEQLLAAQPLAPAAAADAAPA